MSDAEPTVPLKAAELLHVSLAAAVMSREIKDVRARENLERILQGYRKLRDESLKSQGLPASTASDYSGAAAESISDWLDEKALMEESQPFLEFADEQFDSNHTGH